MLGRWPKVDPPNAEELARGFGVVICEVPLGVLVVPNAPPPVVPVFVEPNPPEAWFALPPKLKPVLGVFRLEPNITAAAS